MYMHYNIDHHASNMTRTITHDKTHPHYALRCFPRIVRKTRPFRLSSDDSSGIW